MVDLLIPMMDERNLRIFEEEGGADFSHTCVTWTGRSLAISVSTCSSHSATSAW